jgi:hypothetical protein
MTFTQALVVALLTFPGAALAGEGEPDLRGLKVKIDKRPIRLQGAVAYSAGSSAVHLAFSTVPLRCEIFDSNGRRLAKNERYFMMTFAPILQPDGGFIWGATQLHVGPYYTVNYVGLDGFKLGGADVDRPVSFSVHQKLHLPAPWGSAPKQNLFRPGHFFPYEDAQIDLAGEVDVPGCGLRHARVHGAPRPQDQLQFSVAGRAFPILGAQLRSYGGRPELTLSTSPLSCDHDNEHDIHLRFSHDGVGDWQIVADGAVLPQKFDPHVPAIKGSLPEGLVSGLSVTWPAEPGGLVHIEGVFALGDLPVRISGEVSAMECL